MNTSQAIRTAPTGTARHGAAATIAIAIVAGTAVAGLFLAAITFGALAIAFPIAAPVAQQFAAMWWVFGGLAIASLAAAAAIVIKTVAYFTPRAAA